MSNLGPREPNNDMVICPNCTCQFVAIPVNVQARLAEAERLLDRVVREDGLRSSTEADVRAFLRTTDSADAGLAKFASDLAASQTYLPPDAARILYENLPELYVKDEADPTTERPK